MNPKKVFSSGLTLLVGPSQQAVCLPKNMVVH